MELGRVEYQLAELRAMALELELPLPGFQSPGFQSPEFQSPEFQSLEFRVTPGDPAR